MNTKYDVVNPYTQKIIGSYKCESWAQVEDKIEIVRQGRAIQRSSNANQRAEVLRKLSELLEARSEEFAQLITLETGKTISDSRVELSRAVNAAVSSSEEARQISGEVLDSDCYAPARSKLGVVTWKPLGTVLCITPFNFPINIAIHKIGPAYAGGNTILFKSSPQNTHSSRLLTELCYEAGMPEQVLQFVMPEVSDLDRLNQHADIDCINFTGSTAVANAIAGVSGYKKLLLELGGNDPLIVMDDGNVDAAVNATINQRFATAGQRCTAAKRVFVQRGVYERFKTQLVEKTNELVVGDPDRDDTFVGPVINEGAAKAIRLAVENALHYGAKVLTGHRYDGALVFPTVLEGVSPQADITKSEVFGPVVPLFLFDDVSEIVPIINNSRYGLQAGVFTENLMTLRFLFDELEVGTLICNDGPGFRTEHFPFGGVKESGIGREGIKYAIREMSVTKTLVL